MATEIKTSPYAKHEDVPTPAVGDSIVYTITGSDMKWEKKSQGLRLPYVEPLSARKERLKAAKEAAKDADFVERATRLGYTKNV